MSLTLVHAALHEILGPVLDGSAVLLDDVPDQKLDSAADENFPSVVLGRIAVTTYMPDDGEGSQLLAYQAELEVWSRYAGRKESHEILDVLTDALHRTSVEAEGIGRLIFVLDSSQPVELQADGRTRRGSITFTVRLLTQA
jgi:hypothetical protein